MKWSSIPKKEVLFSINDPPPTSCVSVNLKVQSFATHHTYIEQDGYLSKTQRNCRNKQRPSDIQNEFSFANYPN